MKPITDMLRDVRKGQLVNQATEEMNALVRAVLDTGMKGELTITLKVKPNKNTTDQVVISSEVKTKTPRLGVADAIFFTDAEGDLHRSDPNQKEMFTEAPRPQLGVAAQ